MTGKERRLAIIAFSLFIIFFAIIDLLLGIFLIPRDYSDFRTRDPWYHHGLKKNVTTQAAWGPIIYPFYTNNLGFRDLLVRDIPLKTDNKRILILGDSHSEGVGIDYQYTFAGRLQKMFENKGVDILNASAVSYSPKIHYLKGDLLLNHKNLEVDEVWVIIDISDLQNEIAYRDFEPIIPGIFSKAVSAVRLFFNNRSFTIHSLAAIKENREYEIFRETLMGFEQKVSKIPTRNAIELYKEFFRHFNDADLLRDPNFHGVSDWIYDKSLRELADEGLDLGMEYISMLNSICRDKDIKLRLSVHPWQTQIIKGDTTDYYVERWREFCLNENIGFMNLYPLFINHENPVWVAKTCYIEGDNHWNELGHARVARYLSEFID